jgi:hypothetical protein
MTRIVPAAMAIGPLKGGSSWLHEFLAWRADVCLPGGVKETFYFDRYFQKGDSWYRAHFRHFDAARHRMTIEVAPSYFHCADAPRRIHACLGRIRLITMLRNPVNRSWSHYAHLLRYGHTRASLRDAAAQHPALVEASRYATRIREWQAVFGEGSIAVLLYEDLSRDYQAFADQVCWALDLPRRPVPDSLAQPRNAAAVAPSYHLASFARKIADRLRARQLYPLVNFAKRVGLKRVVFGRPGAGAAPPVLQEADREWLSQQLEPEVRQLEALLQRDLSMWRLAMTPREAGA